MRRFHRHQYLTSVIGMTLGVMVALGCVSGCDLLLPMDVTGTWRGETTEAWPSITLVGPMTLNLIQNGKEITGTVDCWRGQEKGTDPEYRYLVQTGFLDGSRLYIYAECDDTSDWDQDRTITLTGEVSSGHMSGLVTAFLDSAVYLGHRLGDGATGTGIWYANKQ